MSTPHNYEAYTCAIYRPPDSSKNLFTQGARNFFSTPRFKQHDLYFLGDINIDLKSNDGIREFYANCMSELCVSRLRYRITLELKEK